MDAKGVWSAELAALLESVPIKEVWSYVYQTLGARFGVTALSVIAFRSGARPLVVCDVSSQGHKHRRWTGYQTEPTRCGQEPRKKNGHGAFRHVGRGSEDVLQIHPDLCRCDGSESDSSVFSVKTGLHMDVSGAVLVASGHDIPASENEMRDFLSEGQSFLGVLVRRSSSGEEQKSPQARNTCQSVERFSLRLKTALKSMGSAVLSPREKTILDYMIRGYSVRATSEKLGITEGTIRIHRHSMYTKLDVSSQIELFALIIDSLKQLEFGVNCDPLAHFLPPD
ncbi:MAG: helix-turn-helix transcriptional regulator [Hyphomonadaceae bacterium]|nr:helix-turn-helix transcriptional regulator [Hyphomonadaceae bacterium]